MNTLEKCLNDSLKSLDHDLFKDVVKVETDIQPMGDGQVVVISEIKRVVLTLTKSNGEKVKVNTVVKVEIDGASAGKQMAFDSGAFTTETLMYNEVLKIMANIMKDVGDNKIIWPDCYYCADNKFMFQDLCEAGYKIVPTYKFLDPEHTFLVMEGIGKFHALSMILKEKSLIDISKFKEPFFCQNNPQVEQMMQFGINHLLKSMRESWDSEWLSVADRLEKYLSVGMKGLQEVWEKTKGKWDVINHGDFSMRNMMFHYPTGSSHPDGVKFIDFQMCHYSNFAFDLTMILYSSLLPDVRDGNMDKYLTKYLNSLTSTLKTHQYKGSIPTMKDVMDAMDSLNFMSVTMPLFSLPFFIESSKEDIQTKADEYMKAYESVENAKGMINYSDKNIQSVVKSELQRCMKLNIF